MKKTNIKYMAGVVELDLIYSVSVLIAKLKRAGGVFELVGINSDLAFLGHISCKRPFNIVTYKEQ